MKSEDKVKEVLDIQKQVNENTKEALRQLGLTENLVELHSAIMPNFNKLLPEEILQIFKSLKEYTILYFHNLGLSQREITKRIGGLSLKVVNNTVVKVKPRGQQRGGRRGKNREPD